MKMTSCALVLTAAVAAAGSVGCGSKSPSGPSNQPTIFTVALKASNEVPTVSGAEANAAGTAVITVNTTRDSGGAITGATIDFNVSMNGFPNGSSAILSHIHPGAAGVAGPVLVNTGLTAGTAIQMPNGSGSFSFTGVSVSADNATQILANPQNFYFNVHTPANPAGAIRGQLR
jgi:hypothetical protein